MINASDPVTKIIITNGFHHSRVVTVKNKPGIHFYEVESGIDNIQLMTGLVMTLLFFIIYIFTGLFFFMLFANTPLLIMLYILYFRRKNFIRVHILKPGHHAVRN